MYKFSLDKSSKKFICPSCEKKTFVRYIDNETKQFICTDVGRCDREINCGYHYSPKEYFRDNGWKHKQQTNNETMRRNISKNVTKHHCQKVSYIDYEMFAKSLYSDFLSDENYFVDYLKQIFDTGIVSELVSRFRIGSSKYWKGATVFWQIDNHQKVRSGKIILYDKTTGKRTKNITWVHSVLKLKKFNLKQCLFGLHQLNNSPEHIIGIVESEKTAIIMSGLSLQEKIMQNFIWMATGSLNMLKEEMLIPVKKRNILLFPDLGLNKSEKGNPYRQWALISEHLNRKGYNIRVSNLLEEIASSEEIMNGFDLADYIL